MNGARSIALRTWIVAVVATATGAATVQACSALGVDGGHARRAGTAAVRLAAAPVGQTAAGRAGVTPGTATIRPVRAGRLVQVQAQVGGSWRTVSKVRTNGRGQVAFNVADPSLSYRAVAPATSTELKVVSPVARSANWGAPTWHDEFAGSGPLDPAVWATRQAGFRGGLRRCAEVRASNAYRQNGAAVLKIAKLPGRQGAKTRRCKYGQFSNAMVAASNDQHRLTYGFAASRVKFSPLRGQHSAFWLQSPDDASITLGDPSTGAEIDIAEYFGDGRPKGGIASFIHWAGTKGGQSVGGELRTRGGLLPTSKEWSQAWHVFSVEWSPSGYIFRIDGRKSFATTRAVSRSPEMVVLSALTSDWEIPALKTRRLPTVTRYDWVRVWQRPAS